MKGIILLAIGNQSYLYWAYNQALSIKANSPDIPIQLLTEKRLIEYFDLKHRRFFDKITFIHEEDCYEKKLIKHGNAGIEKKRLFPALAKLKLYNYSHFKETIYLDVDGCCVRPMESLFEQCTKEFHSQVGAVCKYQETQWRDMHWASPQMIYEHYKLPKDFEFPALNSSFSFFKKSEIVEKIFKQALENLLNPIPYEKLHNTWGQNQPDELYMNIALGQLKHNPDGVSPVYFSFHHINPLRLEQIIENYWLVGLWGDKMMSHAKIKIMYEGMIHKYAQKFGTYSEFKLSYLWDSKFVTAGKKPL